MGRGLGRERSYFRGRVIADLLSGGKIPHCVSGKERNVRGDGANAERGGVRVRLSRELPADCRREPGRACCPGWLAEVAHWVFNRFMAGRMLEIKNAAEQARSVRIVDKSRARLSNPGSANLHSESGG